MGVLLILFLSLNTTLVRSQLTHPKFCAYRKLFHDLLVFHEFLFNEEHYTSQFPVIEKQVRMCMRFMKDTVNRQEGNGFKYPKYHQILHALRNIERHGSMRNYDGGPEECLGKVDAKEPSRLTQKRIHTIAMQSGERLSEKNVLDFRMRDLKRRGMYGENTTQNNDHVDEMETSYGGNNMRYHLWKAKVVNTTLIPSGMVKQGFVMILCHHYYFH